MTDPSPETIPRWPALPHAEWQATQTTLHLWTQIVGKIRLRHSPWLNHSWHVPLYVTPRGLTTSTFCSEQRSLQIDFDFVDQRLVFTPCDQPQRSIPLRPQSTAGFHAAVKAMLRAMAWPDDFHGRPNEVVDAILFAQDIEQRPYDADAATRFWRALLQIDRVFRKFRARFLGKASPVHFFWGSFDLAVTRFTGREAPEHPGGFPNLPDRITREAYSHEVSSAGFWPGGPQLPEPVFFSYAYPTPSDMKSQPVEPVDAYWHEQLAEFVLPYEAVRTAEDPDAALMAFLESTYSAAAKTGNWDRSALERTFEG